MGTGKHNTFHKIKHHASHTVLGAWILGVILLFGTFIGNQWYNGQYLGKIYPNVYVDSISFGGKTVKDVENYWETRNMLFTGKQFEFVFENRVATLSGTELGLGYDAALSGAQAYLVGRSNYTLSNLYNKYIQKQVNLTAYFRWKDDVLSQAITDLSQQLDIPVQDALFDFRNGKVTAFKPSVEGRKVNVDRTKERFAKTLKNLSTENSDTIVVPLLVDPIVPTIATHQTNIFGIKERISQGNSEFAGSIPGRIHNVALAATRLHGILIKPGEEFSFNKAVGDISAATGFQTAYIIKDGRTVLGDGGGVCQVSSTLFRALLNAGLPIIERRAHAYRVHYYEEGGFKPGLDATVFAPSVDLKFKNDTPGYILIQTKPDVKRLTLVIDLYGTSDGRKAEILNHQVWGISPPPPPLYQDDPTLPLGVTKQVDFPAWGAKTSFEYKVTRAGEILEDTKFYSNFRPWQAVYLRGITVL